MTRTVYNINPNWAFSKDVEAIPQRWPNDWSLVNLPHTWNGQDGQDGGNDYFRGKGYYAKKLVRSKLPQAPEYFLEIKGANSSAEIYLNNCTF